MSLKLDYPVAQSAIVKHMKDILIPAKIADIAIGHTINNYFTRNESIIKRAKIQAASSALAYRDAPCCANVARRAECSADGQHKQATSAGVSKLNLTGLNLYGSYSPPLAAGRFIF